jgi:phage recombination protein Bet
LEAAVSLTTTTDRADVISVLRSSLYPGAKTESIELVLSYCRINGLDPMLKPVHIVPTSIKVGDRWETRDVLMPGIADYRIKAARSGEYLGKSEPIFGPVVTDTIGNTKVTYPEWCKITIRRSVGGKEAEFTATEYWLENYASKKRDDPSPNAMWHKRAFGQLAKCTEAQVLRMAFPEFSGGAVTAEEMEGKVLEGVVEAAPAPPAKPQITAKEWTVATIARFTDAVTYEEVSALCQDEALGKALGRLEVVHPDLYAAVDKARMAAMDRVQELPYPPADGELPE